ncbi:MAG TPA: urea ABC transporter ATP-binding subunit UrtE [Arachnia sp.]|mgnify:CR=1 FL=1|nr:urea ABC transporter ATP-binding subunit UrtE [Arachnia sp.]HMT87085.1 urea ABC transporter ATP-binding subunit UrtE [Arachnia sp.]
MLNLNAVTTGYGRVSVVFDVSLEVPAGALVAVLGVNGAGKTTLLRAVMGLLPVRSGSITFDGADITRLRTNQRVRRGLAYVPQGQQSFGQLTTKENLLLVADRYGAQGARRMDEALDLFPALPGLLGRRAGLLSGGQRQQLAIARALITGPALMVLDEPTEGIQPSVVAEIQQAIRAMSEESGMAVLMVEQHVGFAVRQAERYVVLASGRVVDEGTGGSGSLTGVRAAMAL